MRIAIILRHASPSPLPVSERPSIKIINSADSGAGIRDVFFEEPEGLPVVCYIDEIESLGNKAAGTRNPAILDTMIELANSLSVSRVKAAKGNKKASKSRDDARFCMFICGQDGPTFMKAFAGRTKLGMFDRLYPEFGQAVEAGKLPAINAIDAYKLLDELKLLDYSGTITMTSDAKKRLDDFWQSQTPDVRKKARYKNVLTLDAYMSAFGRGSKVAEIDDVEIAIKIFTRQLIIRRVFFTEEVPDRTGYCNSWLKKLTERMQKQLDAGMPADQVAKSRRDFENMAHSFRDNEGHIFEKAWSSYSRVHLKRCNVTKANGRVYEKWLPADPDS